MYTNKKKRKLICIQIRKQALICIHFGTEIAIITCMMEEDKKRDKKTNFKDVVSARVSPTTRMMLEEISREEKLKITELVREAIKEYIINKIGA